MLNADSNELHKFNSLASSWWDEQGAFKTLHQINPLRLAYIQRYTQGLSGKKVIDVGCGGGILAEAMAKAGAEVTAIDLAEDALQAAREHAQQTRLSIDYQLIAVEQQAANAADQYDVVSCLEMLEHVPDPASVIQACATLCKPGGHVFFSTINRNAKAFLLAIVGAEYLLQLLPKNTHEYAKFIKPSELADWARQNQLSINDISGLRYNPLTEQHSLGHDIDINYLMHCPKPVLD